MPTPRTCPLTPNSLSFAPTYPSFISSSNSVQTSNPLTKSLSTPSPPLLQQQPPHPTPPSAPTPIPSVPRPQPQPKSAPSTRNGSPLHPPTSAAPHREAHTAPWCVNSTLVLAQRNRTLLDGAAPTKPIPCARCRQGALRRRRGARDSPGALSGARGPPRRAAWGRDCAQGGGVARGGGVVGWAREGGGRVVRDGSGRRRRGRGRQGGGARPCWSGPLAACGSRP